MPLRSMLSEGFTLLNLLLTGQLVSTRQVQLGRPADIHWVIGYQGIKRGLVAASVKLLGHEH